MATPIIMPKQGLSVESCVLVKWHKKKGEMVKTGDLLFTSETDKAAFEVESEVTGILLEIYVQEGDDVNVLSEVCIIGESHETIPEAAAITKPQVLPPQTNHPLKISPRARAAAQRAGIDCLSAIPTGPGGRIIERDIAALKEHQPQLTYTAKAVAAANGLLSASEGTGIGGRISVNDLSLERRQDGSRGVNGEIQPELPAYSDTTLSNIRKVIGKAMHESLQASAQLTLHASFDANNLIALRKQFKEAGSGSNLEEISLNDMILFALSRTLPQYPALNANLIGDTLRIFNHVQLGVAVDTPRGLLVPTLADADLKSLRDISRDAKELSARCREGTISPDALKEEASR